MPDLLDRAPADVALSGSTRGRRTRRGVALLVAFAVAAGGSMMTSPAVAAAPDAQALVTEAVLVEPPADAANAGQGAALSAAAINPTRGTNWIVHIDGVTASFSSAYQWLDKGHAWTFPNNTKALLTLQPDGNLVLYDVRPSPDEAKWASHTTGKTSITQLLFRPDGHLVLYTAGYANEMWSNALWGTCSSGYEPALALQSDSNVVVYCQGYFVVGNAITYRIYPIWSTGTVF